MLPTFPLKPPYFLRDSHGNFPHEIKAQGIQLSEERRDLNGAAGWRRGSFTHHFMGISWGIHGEFMRFDGDFMRFDGDFMGIYMTLPDLWVPQLMASLVVIDSTMIIIVDDMEVS